MIKNHPISLYRHRQNAFTIIELLVVIMLIALLATASGGMYWGTLRNMQARRSARQLLLAAKYARTFAIENQIACTLEIIQNQGIFLLKTKVLDNDRTVRRQISDLYARPGRLAEGIEFQVIQKNSSLRMDHSQSDQHSITFFPDGSAETAIIQLGDSQRHYTISISSATGIARVHQGTIQAIKPDSIDLDLSQNNGIF